MCVVVWQEGRWCALGFVMPSGFFTPRYVPHMERHVIQSMMACIYIHIYRCEYMSI